MPVHYLDGVVTANALAYRKIFDMTQATPNLGEDELPLSQIGPLAIVATTENGYQQARMFAALAEADRPVKIFRELHLARQWLDSRPHPQPKA